MRSRWVPVLGWVECALGFVLLLVSVVGFTHDTEEPHAFAWDVFTYALLLFTLRWPRIGLGLLIAAAFAGLLIDPEGIGMSHYIAACAVVLAVRLGRYPFAIVGTATLGGALFYTILRRSGGWIITSSIGTVLIYLIVWVLGLGMRSVAAAEAARVEARHHKRQLEVAADLHDFVSGNLATLVMAAEALPDKDPAVEDLVLRARQANAALRRITAVLRGEDHTAGPPAMRATQALAQGAETIAALGGRAQVAPGTNQALAGLPDGVDQAVGRIVTEALCNAAKHADHDEPVVVAAERAGGRLDLMVSNGIAEPAFRNSDSMGLFALRQHAEVIGGRAESSALGGVWVCTASLPLPAPGGTR